jgi:hypothetical protein
VSAHRLRVPLLSSPCPVNETDFVCMTNTIPIEEGVAGEMAKMHLAERSDDLKSFRIWHTCIELEGKIP